MSLREQTVHREVLPELSHLSVTQHRSSCLGKKVTLVPPPKIIQLSLSQRPYSALQTQTYSTMQTLSHVLSPEVPLA